MYRLPDHEPPLWWQGNLIYQVYPRSFMDGNQDGVGDLIGLNQRLDYLEALGIRCVWLSPVYPSPLYDFGYDVADYTSIDPVFGSLAEWERLLSRMHAKGMKLIMDWVPNHTSHQHPWFIESRASRTSPKRDWYIWRDPGEAGGPPNNWISFFGGSAWELDAATGQYYLHQFVREQPELNYRNPAVLEAMLEAMRLWLDRGVDGFRVDVLWLLIKDAAFRDEPLNRDWNGENPHARLHHIHTANQPEVHPIVRAFRALLDQYPQRVMMGEIDLPFAELMTYYGIQRDECHLPTNFSLIHTRWTVAAVRRVIDDYLASLPVGAWPNWVLGNHDQRRLASRLGQPQARVATLLLLTLPGTPVWYYGDEIGLENGIIPPEQIRDPQAVNQPDRAGQLGRDPQRTPMQWDASAHAGFTQAGVTPWLPVSVDYLQRNVAVQDSDEASFLGFFRQLIRLRTQIPALTRGDYSPLPVAGDAVLAYRRTWSGKTWLILLNFSAERQRLDGRQYPTGGRKILSTLTRTGPEVANIAADITLEPDEGCIVELTGPA